MQSNVDSVPLAGTAQGTDIMITSGEYFPDMKYDAKSKKKSKNAEKKRPLTEEEKAELGTYFRFFKFSVRKVATHLAIVFFFVDLLAITTASRNHYLVYQWLFVLSVIGPPSLVFAVNVDAYYGLAFIASYATCVLRFLINGFLIYIYYEALNTQQLREEEWIYFQDHLNETPNLNDKMPIRDKRLFRSPVTFYFIITMCCVMILLQLWAIIIVIPKSQMWIRKRYGVQPVNQEKKE